MTQWLGAPSVWAINEWDPNSYAPPGEEIWLRDRTTTGGQAQWVDPRSGYSISWAAEDGHGSGHLALAA